MGTKEDIGEKRLRFMYRLYQLSEGEESQEVSLSKIREEMGLSLPLTQDIIAWLEEEGLVRSQPSAGTISIRSNGADEIEEALMEADHATRHFPPMRNISRDRENLEMPQASVEDLQMITVGSNRYRDLKEVIQLLNASIDTLGLDTQQRNNLRVELNAIEIQMISAKPKAVVIPKSLDIIRRILEGASGSPLDQDLLSKILALMS
jgi:hypothetical protein